MSNKNEPFLFIVRQYRAPTCAGDSKKKYKTSSLRSPKISQPAQGNEEEGFVQKKATYIASGCWLSIVSNVNNMYY